MGSMLRALVLVVPAMACHAGSVQPLFAPNERVELPAATGRWVQQGTDDPAALRIEAGQDRTFKVLLADGKDERLFTVAFGRIGKAGWIDVQLSTDDPAFKPVDTYVLRPHYFMKAALDGDVLTLWLPKKEWLRKQLATKRIKLPHQILNPEDDAASFVVFAAPTKDLQAAIKRAQADAAAFDDPLTFKRQPGDGPASPPSDAGAPRK